MGNDVLGQIHWEVHKMQRDRIGTTCPWCGSKVDRTHIFEVAATGTSVVECSNPKCFRIEANGLVIPKVPNNQPDYSKKYQKCKFCDLQCTEAIIEYDESNRKQITRFQSIESCPFRIRKLAKIKLNKPDMPEYGRDEYEADMKLADESQTIRTKKYTSFDTSESDREMWLKYMELTDWVCLEDLTIEEEEALIDAHVMKMEREAKKKEMEAKFTRRLKQIDGRIDKLWQQIQDAQKTLVEQSA